MKTRLLQLILVVAGLGFSGCSLDSGKFHVAGKDERGCRRLVIGWDYTQCSINAADNKFYCMAQVLNRNGKWEWVKADLVQINAREICE